jgi:hypothetical protein
MTAIAITAVAGYVRRATIAPCWPLCAFFRRASVDQYRFKLSAIPFRGSGIEVTPLAALTRRKFCALQARARVKKAR